MPADRLVLAGQPRLGFQPVVDLGSGQLLGFEALLRWYHPTEGVIRPRLLIPWAEANGDIVALGEWVLREGCREAMSLAARACSWPSTARSSSSAAAWPRSAAVVAALEESGLTPDRLTIEVTEQALSDEAAVDDLRAIAALGVQLAVDDVGTSWNSFEILRRLAVNTSRSTSPSSTGSRPNEGINRMVVETVVHLAHNCGMATVAEGVETRAARRHRPRVRLATPRQGYFFAPPLDAEDSATSWPTWSTCGSPWRARAGTDDDDWPFPGAPRGHRSAPPRAGPGAPARPWPRRPAPTPGSRSTGSTSWTWPWTPPAPRRRGTRATPTSRATRTGRPVTPGAARTRRPTPSAGHRRRGPRSGGPDRGPPQLPDQPVQAPRTADLGFGVRRRPARKPP